jgi:serine/threonine-protein kinase
VLLDRTDSGALDVTLLDFGVCAAETAPSDERNRENGRVFGTPSYVSPEQAGGNPEVDARADVWALGVVMFEALTGRLPFSAPSVSVLLRRIIREDAPRVGLVAPHVSWEMDAVVARALSREPEERFPTARALGRALAPIVGDRLDAERRLGRHLRVGQDAGDRATTTPEVAAA